MSRTIRRKYPTNGYYNLKFALRDWDSDSPTPIRLDPKSKEGRKRVAKYHADSTVRWKEPGPAWFRNLTTERPQRREAQQQLHRYLQGEEFEVILEAKMPLDYWT